MTRSACSRKRRGLKNQALESIEDAEEKYEEAPWPEEQALDRQLVQAFNSALDRLPDEYREVILLRDIEALTAPEAADALGISVPALKRRPPRRVAALKTARLSLSGDLPQ